MFTLSNLRATLRAAELIVDDVDDADELYLGFEGEAVPFFDMFLSIVDDLIAVRIEVPGLPLDDDDWGRARRWLRREEVDGDLTLDDDGDTTITLHGAIDEVPVADMPDHVTGAAALAEQAIATLVAHLESPDEELQFMKPAIDLHQSGHPLEAIAALQDLVATDDHDHRLTPRARGCLLGALGDLLLEVGRTSEAVTAVEEAISLHGAADEPRLAALTETGLVSVDVASGDHRGGLARCGRLIQVLEEVGGPGDLDLLMVQRAQVLVAAGEYDDAIALLAPLEQRLSERSSPQLATARLALGNCLLAIGNPDGGLSMLRSAEGLFAQANQVLDVGLCQVAVATALVRAERQEEALDAVARARTTIAPFGMDEQMRTLQFCESLALRGLGALAGALRLAREVRDGLAADPSANPVHLATAELDLGAIAQQAGDLATAIEASSRAEVLFARVGAPVEKARARVNHLMARAEEAMRAERLDVVQAPQLYDDVMVAVRWIEEARQDLTSVADRTRWAHEVSRIFAMAAVLGTTAGRHRRVAELLDRVLAQGLPDPDASAVEDVEPAGAGEAELVAVRAALRDLGVGSPPVGDVDLATKAAGGSAAWRWLLWHTDGMILWGLIGPDARAHTGVIPVDAPRHRPGSLPADLASLLTDIERERIGPELGRLRRAEGVGVDGGGRGLEIRRGLLVEDPHDEEPGLAWELGRKLVPPVLADELRRRLGEVGPAADPLPLVIAASPGLASVAFGLLGIEAPTPERTMGRRLVEAAVITMAAPSALVERRAGQVVPAAGPRPVRVAVVNPTGDLRHTVPVLDDHPGSGVDPRRLHDELRAVTPGEPGVMWWDGHAEPGPAGRPLDACWPLSRHADGGVDERLSVEDLLAGDIHVPSRAVLFGCTTMGVDEQLTEWWGFPVALMYAGATAVAASTWDLFDCPAAADFAAGVLRAAIDADDLAAALRERQLRWLDDWQQRRDRDRALRFDAHDRHPHIWAGWSVVSLHRG